MITIRDASMEDAEAIARFSAALAFETEAIELDRRRLLDGVRALLSDPQKGRYFIAEIDGEVAGQTSVTYEWSDWRNGAFWWIQSVYVDPAHRKRGVYRALHNYIQQKAQQAGSIGLRLYVEKENASAQEAYRVMGMTECPYQMFERAFQPFW
ncbi:MAG: GNAT family N-acetyltransferase [Candidatus Omnitrophica bacterium]|nr:GNAT family N-acetyltransferase [Candidatus Omnitrophota bacterium]